MFSSIQCILVASYIVVQFSAVYITTPYSVLQFCTVYMSNLVKGCPVLYSVERYSANNCVCTKMLIKRFTVHVRSTLQLLLLYSICTVHVSQSQGGFVNVSIRSFWDQYWEGSYTGCTTTPFEFLQINRSWRNKLQNKGRKEKNRDRV